MARRRTRSIRRQYFALFLLASVVPVLAAGVASIFSTQEALVTRTAQDNTVLAQSIATVVQNQIITISGSAEDAAGAPSLRSALAAGGDPAEVQSALANISLAHREFAALGVASAQGEVIARWPPGSEWMLGRNLSDENFVAIHISSSGTFQSSVPTFVGSLSEFDTPDGHAGPYIPVSTAIRDEVETEQGILLGFVPAVFFESVIPPLPARELRAFLFDSSGNVITSEVSSGATAFPTPNDMVGQSLAMSTESSGSTRTVGSEGQLLAFALASSGSAHWAVVVGIPLSVVLTEAASVLVLSFGIVVAAALVAAIFAAVLSGRTVGPIMALTDATRNLERADELPSAMKDRGDEIGTLSRSFGEMAAAVKAESAANRKLIARLQELDRLKTALIDTVSHELRTPITIIRGNAELLTMEVSAPPERIARTATRIVQASEQLAYLVEELIELGQVQARQSSVRPVMVDFNVLVEGVRDLEADHARRKGVDVTLELGRDHAPFEADAPKLRIAVRNLLSNAIKFSHHGGKVTVTTRARDGGVELKVKDEGVGIKDEAVPHIFEAFYQSDGSVTRLHGGAGVGLALVHQFVELHHGKVAVDTVDGRGSTFTVWLPGSPGAAAAPG
jgi:signal transduction histidine kinase